MPDLDDGESIEMQGSGSKPYVLKNVGGVYSCSCPAWRNQSIAIEKRTCKHLRKLRGDEAEEMRVGGDLPERAQKTKEDKDAPALLLAERWDGAMNLAGWWMSEKLDGVRAYWTGTEFLSRQGNPLFAPDWFSAGLPKEPLDGEFWIERKKFQRTVSIVRRQDKNDLWKEVRFLMFDAPEGGDAFEERMKTLERIVKKNQPPYALAHEHSLCKDLDHLRGELARVEALGGEGLMLRQPGSKYQAGRSMTLLKIKTFHDAEGRVVGHEPGAGRHKGRLGALLVEMADGTKFSVGTGFSDAERESPPALGSTITFRYQELSDRGVPRFPSFVRATAQFPPTLPSPAEAAPPAATRTSRRVGPARNASAGPPPTTSTSPTQSQEPRAMKRYFEYTDEKSNKFWEIDMDGTSVTVRYGRIGASGQTQTKTFPDAAAAQKHHDKLVEEKTEKGYEEKEAE